MVSRYRPRSIRSPAPPLSAFVNIPPLGQLKGRARPVSLPCQQLTRVRRYDAQVWESPSSPTRIIPLSLFDLPGLPGRSTVLKFFATSAFKRRGPFTGGYLLWSRSHSLTSHSFFFADSLFLAFVSWGPPPDDLAVLYFLFGRFTSGNTPQL